MAKWLNKKLHYTHYILLLWAIHIWFYQWRISLCIFFLIIFFLIFVEIEFEVWWNGCIICLCRSLFIECIALQIFIRWQEMVMRLPRQRCTPSPNVLHNCGTHVTSQLIRDATKKPKLKTMSLKSVKLRSTQYNLLIDSSVLLSSLGKCLHQENKIKMLEPRPGSSHTKRLLPLQRVALWWQNIIFACVWSCSQYTTVCNGDEYSRTKQRPWGCVAMRQFLRLPGTRKLQKNAINFSMYRNSYDGYAICTPFVATSS